MTRAKVQANGLMSSLLIADVDPSIPSILRYGGSIHTPKIARSKSHLSSNVARCPSPATEYKIRDRDVP